MLKNILFLTTLLVTTLTISTTHSLPSHVLPQWYGFAEMQGRRPSMEDAHCLEVNKEHIFAGLYDGHGGRQVADFAAQHLHKNIIIPQNIVTTQNAARDSVYDALYTAFIKTNDALDTVSFDAHSQGCTAIAALIRNNMLYVASAGDSRAVLSCAGKAQALSCDHKPDRLDEKLRIEQLGGKITMHGVPRVNGDLAISRALGDKRLSPYVIPNPEVYTKNLTAADEFLIIACDGVWDVIDNQTAVDIVRKNLIATKNDAHKAADILKKEAFQQGSTDNISVMVLDLKKLSAQMQ